MDLYTTDYAGINRALKRRVRKAKQAGSAVMTETTSFMENVSKALDELWQAAKRSKEGNEK